MKKNYNNKLLACIFFVFTIIFATIGGKVCDASSSKIVVALPDNIPILYYSTNETKAPDGLMADIWRLWGKQSNTKIEFVSAPMQESLLLLKEGKADFHGLVTRDIANRYDLVTSVPLYKLSAGLFYSIKGSAHKKLGVGFSLEGLAKKSYKIGMLKESIYNMHVLSRVPSEKIVYFDNVDVMVAALEKEDIAAFVESDVLLRHFRLTAQYDIAASKKNMPSVFLYAGVNRKHNNLIYKINSNLSLVKEEEFAKVETKWLNNPSERVYDQDEKGIEITDRDIDAVKGYKKIKIAINRHLVPYEFLDEAGVYHGVSSEYIKFMSDKTGVKFEIVPTTSQQEALSLFESGKVDIISGADQSGFDANDPSIVMTSPYISSKKYIFMSPQNFLVEKIEDLQGRVIAIEEGDAGLKRALLKYKNIFAYSAKSAYEGLLAVADGSSDAYLGEYLPTSYLADVHHLGRIRAVASTDLTKNFVFVGHKNMAPVINVIDKIITSISEQQKRRLINKWLHFVKLNREDVKNYARITLSVSFFVVMLLSVFVLWNRRLQTEIKERRDVEQRLRVSEANHRAMVNAAPIPMFLYDEGVVTYANYTLAKLMGTNDSDDIVGLRILDFVHEDSYKNVQQIIEHGLVSTDRRDSIYRIYNLKSEEKIVESRSITIDMEPKPMTLVMLVDITESLKTAKEKEKLQDQLRQSQKMDSIGQLAGGIAHDFNNMLSGIMGSAELLSIKMGADNPLIKYTETILKASKRASELTSQLLLFSRKANVKIETLSAHDCIKETMLLLERGIDRRITVKKELSAPLDFIEGDKAQLQSAVLNLGVNARDAITDKGTITIKTSNVTLDENYCKNSLYNIREGEFLLLEIIDDGMGMSQETKDRVFEPFFTTKGVGKGTGLGLSAVYGYINDINGAIEIESELEKGSNFKIYLPLSTQKVESDSNVEEGKEYIGDGKVLLVDDEEILLEAGKEILETLGYKVVAVNDPEKALRIYSEQPNSFDVVVLDVVMPKMSGKDLYLEMKQLNPSLRALFVSGFNREERLTEILQQENVFFVQKPYSVKDIIGALRELA